MAIMPPYSLVIDPMNRNSFLVSNTNQQQIRITKDLRDAFVIFSLHDYIFQCSLHTLIKMMKIPLRKTKYNVDRLDRTYRNAVSNDQHFYHIRCDNLNFFQNFDSYFQSINGPKMIDIEIPYPFMVSFHRKLEKTVVTNIIDDTIHTINEFENVSCLFLNSGLKSFSNVAIGKHLLQTLYKYRFDRKSNELILNMAIKSCKTLKYEEQNHWLIYEMTNYNPFYINHQDEVRLIMQNYQ